MPIKIDITLSSGGRFKPVASRTLDKPLITIGRDEDCTLTLEDAQKHVSRVHAELQEEGGRYWMKVVSKVNPVIVNGKRLMYGNRVALSEGDAMTIGLYRLEILVPEPPANASQGAVDPTEDVTYVRGAMPAAAPLAPPQIAATTEEATFVPPPLAMLPEVPAETEEATYVPGPKAAPAEPVPPASSTPANATENDEATYLPPVSARPAPPPEPNALDLITQRLAQFRRPPETTIPDAQPGPDLDFDLSEEETYVRPTDAAVPPPGQEPSPPVAVDLSSDEITFVPPVEEPKPAPPAALSRFAKDGEEDFSDEATMIRRPSPAAPPPAKPAPPALEEEIEEDFSDDATMIRRPSPVPPPPAQPAPPALEEKEEDFSDDATMIRRPAPATAPPAPPPVAAARPATAGSDPIVQAFLEGSGLTHLAVSDAQAFMRSSGAIVAAAVEGIMALLLAREQTLKELGASAAEAGGGANPLMSMSSPAEALTFLLDPKRPLIGDSDPRQALGDICGDLRVHQDALLATLKAAVVDALGSVDPRKIEREHGTNLGGLNLTRKSKLWDLSIAQHEKLSHDMQEDFNSVFGREILAAYLAQVGKGRGGS